METIRDYLIENPRYLTQDEAHTASFEYDIASWMNGSEQAASSHVNRKVWGRSRYSIIREGGRMSWTIETPTASGYYWWREPGRNGAYLVEVDVEKQRVSSPGTHKDASLDMMDGGEWYGPLKQPE